MWKLSPIAFAVSLHAIPQTATSTSIIYEAFGKEWGWSPLYCCSFPCFLLFLFFAVFISSNMLCWFTHDKRVVHPCSGFEQKNCLHNVPFGGYLQDMMTKITVKGVTFFFFQTQNMNANISPKPQNISMRKVFHKGTILLSCEMFKMLSLFLDVQTCEFCCNWSHFSVNIWWQW